MNSPRPVLTFPLLALLLAAPVGCQDRSGGEAVAQTAPVVNDDRREADGAPKPPIAEIATEQAAAPTEDDYWRKITALYEQAKESGRTSAASASEWVSDVLGNAVSTGSDAADETTRRVRQLYEDAKARGETTATSARAWVQEDLKRFGAWEYKIVVLPTGEPDQVASELSKLGSERWECFWVDKQGDEAAFYLKKSGRSRLRQLPARDLLRLLAVFGLGTLGDEPAE